MKCPTITCPQCGRVSYHPADIQQRYCGGCHQFHDYMTLFAAAAAETKE